ncbi:MAG: tol-pal system protein YbgF [Candidatus Aminicenantes bacterium]|nr:tol-pal system protein YbgF [Candidatus Aminicenantes bacterium]
MKKGFSAFFALFLISAALFALDGQSKKTYELIYQDLQRLTQHVIDLEETAGQNSEDIRALKKILQELLTLSLRFQTEQASIKEDQKQMPSQFQVVLAKLDALNTKLNTFSAELSEIKEIILTPPEPLPGEQPDEGENKDAPPAELKEKVVAQEENKGEEELTLKKQGDLEGSLEVPQLSPQEVYNIAYSDYLNGNYQLAIDGFSLFLEQFSDSPVADDAAYWIGECYFSQSKFEEAASQFTELILNFPEGDKIPSAYLKKGLSLLELEKKDEALSVFKLLISKYPFEDETRIAQEKIKEIR